MLDLKKLEIEIENFIANETTESYNELFHKTDLLGFIEKVEISGGYTDEFTCIQKIVIEKPNFIDNDSDFYGQNLNNAA